MNARRDPLLPASSAALNRRHFLRVGGLTVATGALVAACGDQGDTTAIPRVGTVPPTTALGEGTVNDVVLLRTATSLEYNLIYVYDALNRLGSLTGDGATIAERIAADHQAHADATAELTTQHGGEPYECANPRLQSVYIEPAMQLILGSKAAYDELGIAEPEAGTIPPSDRPEQDAISFIQALESLATATYQSLMTALTDKALRAETMRIGAQEAEHASLLGLIINPDQAIGGDYTAVEEAASPSTTEAPAVGLPTTVASPDVTEAPAGSTAPVVYAVPSAFGLLSPIVVQLGAPNPSGIRVTASMETPSLNSLAYEFMTCDA